MNNLAVAERYTTKREDDQVCPVDLETDSETVLVKQHKTPLLWTVQTQLENNHRLMYEA